MKRKIYFGIFAVLLLASLFFIYSPSEEYTFLNGTIFEGIILNVNLLINDLSNGVYNNTISSVGNVRLSGTNLSGDYGGEIVNLNMSSAVKNMTVVYSTPEGTSIQYKLRTNNLTSSSTELDKVALQIKFTSSNMLDYSGNNITITPNGNYWYIEKGFGNDNAWVGTNAYSDYVSVDDQKVNMTEGFTLDYRNVQMVSLFGSRYLAWKNPDAGDNLQIYIHYGNPTMLIDGATSDCSISYANSVNDGNLHNLTFWANNSDCRIYVDSIAVKNGTFSGGIVDNYNQLIIGAKKRNKNAWAGKFDEVRWFSYALNDSEISALDSFEQNPWNDWSDYYSGSFSEVVVEDGVYVQPEFKLDRITGSEIVEVNNFTIGFDTGGTGATEVDNPPSSTILTSNNTIFQVSNFTISSNNSDDHQLVNGSIYLNYGGGFGLNSTINISGTYNLTNFSLWNVPDGTHLYYILVSDNASQTFTTPTYTVRVSTTCQNSSCSDGFVCNTQTNACYTSCTSHNHVNESSYCANDGTAKSRKIDGASCEDLEFSGLTDNRVCLGGYCYDDTLGLVGEYCTDVSNGCVESGNEYDQSDILCYIDNDYSTCLGGESAWSSTIDCIDNGDPFNQIAKTQLGHDYCGYYSAQSCGATGCTPSPSTLENDCGDYFFNTTAGVCGDLVGDDISLACDVNCGATADIETCPEPNTLEDDCTCTIAPDDIPLVNLVSPENNSETSLTTVTFIYNVSDNDPLQNCSLYLSTNTTSWSLNQTNTSSVSRLTNNEFSVSGFINGETVNWGVSCDDTANQTGVSENWTVIINQQLSSEFIDAWYNYSEDKDHLAMSISTSGDLNISRDIYGRNIYLEGSVVGGASSSSVPSGGLLSTDYLTIKKGLTIQQTGNKYIQQTNPFSEYLRWISETKNSLDLALVTPEPYFRTITGAFIGFLSPVQFSDQVDMLNNATILSTLSIGTQTLNATLEVKGLDADGLSGGANDETNKLYNRIGGKGKDTVDGDGGVGQEGYTKLGSGGDSGVAGSGGRGGDDELYGGDASNTGGSNRGGDIYRAGGYSFEGNREGNVIFAYVKNDSAVGKVGIRTNNPSDALTVSGTMNVSGTTKFDSNVGIGTSTPKSTLNIVGSTTTTNTWLNITRTDTGAGDQIFTIDGGDIGGGGYFIKADGTSGSFYVYGNGDTAISGSLDAGGGQGSTGATIDASGNIYTDGSIRSYGANKEIWAGYGSNYVYLKAGSPSLLKSYQGLNIGTYSGGSAIDIASTGGITLDRQTNATQRLWATNITIPEGGLLKIGTNSEEAVANIHTKSTGAGQGKINAMVINSSTEVPGTALKIYADGFNGGSATGLDIDVDFAEELSSNYGIKVDTQGGLNNWGLYINRGDVYINDSIGIGTDSPSYPLHITTNASNISVYAEAGGSFDFVVERTHVWDESKNVWDYLKNASYYLDQYGEIDHQKLYGYMTFKINGTVVEGVDLGKQDSSFRQALFELRTENDMMKSELCNVNSSYSWCPGITPSK